MAYRVRGEKAVAEPPRSGGQESSRNRNRSLALPCELAPASDYGARAGECQGNSLRELAEYVQFITNLQLGTPVLWPGWPGVACRGGFAAVGGTFLFNPGCR